MSTLDNISSVDMFESLITKDPRWSWIVEEWEASSDEKLLTLSETVHRFRENFVKETANLITKLLGDIESPDDVKKYTERAASEGIDTREPEPKLGEKSWESAGIQLGGNVRQHGLTSAVQNRVVVVAGICLVNIKN